MLYLTLHMNSVFLNFSTPVMQNDTSILKLTRSEAYSLVPMS